MFGVVASLLYIAADMKREMNFYEKEMLCETEFREAGPIWHLWTPENFEVIFTCDSDYKAAMTIIGICAKLFPKVVILTFEIMSNHLHFTVCSAEDDLTAFFGKLKKMLKSHFCQGNEKRLEWDKFQEHHRLLESVEDARCVIVYDNRNGFVVSKIHTPFTYPWGANRYYFNPDVRQLASLQSKEIKYKEKRSFSRSPEVDGITDLLMFEDCALPLSFCNIALGERLFHSPVHYFNKIVKNMECNSKIAHEIGESIYYSDDDLFSAVVGICKNKYDKTTPSLLPPEAKIEVARTIRFKYNASVKQIQRMLKLDAAILASVGIN